MTLRGVIQGLFGGSDELGSNDIEATLANNGFGDLPADMFSQALASYADTAPMAEADALTPVFASLETGDPSDVFAVLDQQPLVVDPGAPVGDLALASVSLVGADALDDGPGFGESVAEADDESPIADDEAADDFGDDITDDADALVSDDPFDDAGLPDAADETDAFEELFETEPEATGDDPADLDLDF